MLKDPLMGKHTLGFCSPRPLIVGLWECLSCDGRRKRHVCLSQAGRECAMASHPAFLCCGQVSVRSHWAFVIAVKNTRAAAFSLIFSFCLGFRMCSVQV